MIGAITSSDGNDLDVQTGISQRPDFAQQKCVGDGGILAAKISQAHETNRCYIFACGGKSKSLHDRALSGKARVLQILASLVDAPVPNRAHQDPE